jgi:hypothetical protein
MKVRIKRIDKTLPLPEYKTPGAAAMDLYARETIVIPANTTGYVPLNVVVQVPEEYWVFGMLTFVETRMSIRQFYSTLLLKKLLSNVEIESHK